ncbi:four helix bundle protein [Candidatus Omnitrophota bacterium]
MDNYSLERLELYNLAREYRKRVYDLIHKLPEEEKYNLISQMRRAATSLTNNIAEGHGRYHYQENIQFLRQSRGSLEELLDDLNICIDENYVDKDYIERLKEEGGLVLRKLNGYIKYLKTRKTSLINQSPINQ